MNKDKFLKKLRIGQKVFTAYSNHSSNDWEKQLSGVMDWESYVEIALDQETYKINYFLCLRKNSYLVQDQGYRDETGHDKYQVFKFFFFSKKDYDHFLANRDFYVFEELSKLAKYNFENARINLYSIKEKFKKAKNNLTNKN